MSDDDWLANTLKELTIVSKIKKQIKPGEVGVFQCPRCHHQTLHAGRSSYNGHIHASCSHESCEFGIME